MSGTLQASVVKDSASATNNLALDSSGNVTVGNNLTVSGTGNTSFSGNVGIGTTSPGYSLEVRKDAASATTFSAIRNATASGAYGVAFLGIIGTVGSNYYQLSQSGSGDTALTNANAGNLLFGTNNTERMRIDSSGNVGIGTSSPYGKLMVTKAALSSFTGTATGAIYVSDSTNTNNYYSTIDFTTANNTGLPLARIGMQYTSGGSYLNFGTSNSYASGITNTAMSIDPTGNVGIGTSSPSGKLHVEGSIANNLCRFVNTNASPYGPLIQYPAGVDPNGTSNEFIDCRANGTTQRFAVRSNGGIANYSTNNVNLSDQRLKKDIQLAGSYLDKICAIPVKTFLYNDQMDNEPNLGVIAQDVEAVAPELVSNDGFGDTPEDGVPYKTIYQTDLQYALMKALQEAVAKITALEDRITKLESGI